jgi:thiol-disulfide isomerase/thioredoxin
MSSSPAFLSLQRLPAKLVLLTAIIAAAMLSALAQGDLVTDVRIALSQGNLAGAEAEINSYRAQRGVTPELAEAISWIGRAALDSNQLDAAQTYAKQTRSLVASQTKGRTLDAEPHLPLALGAAIEIESQVLVARGQRAQALSLLRSSLQTYGGTSIRPRIQKNLNLLTMEGRPAPVITATQHLGPAPKPLTAEKGNPVLVFFWAHWCSDCKAEGPVITRLRSEFAPQGLQVIAPTQYYGYAAQGQDANPDVELGWIEKVWQHFYPGLVDLPVPVSKRNFEVYGASTTPTLVLIDRKGLISLYHPGVMPYEELRAAIEKAAK